METKFRIRQFQNPDLKDMLEIFNIFAKTSSAVYCDFELTIEQFKKLLEPARKILIMQNGRKVIGFGFISSYKPFPNFNHTGVLTYFFRQEYTGNGLGTKLLGS
jgi:phosphinothricin acetyltransferase